MKENIKILRKNLSIRKDLKRLRIRFQEVEGGRLQEKSKKETKETIKEAKEKKNLMNKSTIKYLYN